MKKPSIKSLNTILAFGLVFIFAGFLGFLGLIVYGGKMVNLTINIIPFFVCLGGLFTLYLYIAFSRNSFRLFISLMLILNGIFAFFVLNNIFVLSYKELWPVVMILTGISLFVAGRTKKKWLVLSYDLSAFILILLGIIFLLFSLKVIKASFSQVAIISAPIVFVFCGIILIFLFCQRKAILSLLPDEISDELSKENAENKNGELE